MPAVGWRGEKQTVCESGADPAAPSSNTTYSASVLVLWRFILTPFFCPEINSSSGPRCTSVPLLSDLPPPSSYRFAPPLPRSRSCHPPIVLLILPLVSSPYFQPPPPPTLPAEVGCRRCRDNGAVGASATRPVIILSENLLCGWCVRAILHSRQLYLWRYVG